MKLLTIPIIAFSMLFLSFTTHNLEKIDVLDGELTLLIPKEFKQIKTEVYIPAYDGDPKPDEYYSNEDRTIEISFLKMQKKVKELSWFKNFSKNAFLKRASKTYFNDTISINSTKMHLAEFESKFKGKETYSKIFFINLNSVTVIGNISCNVELKDQWLSDASLIFDSIKLN